MGREGTYKLLWPVMGTAQPGQVSSVRNKALGTAVKGAVVMTPHMQGSPSGFAFIDILTKVSALALHSREGQSQTQ